MKPRNARILDDLLAGESNAKVYKFVRDAHVTDLAEVLGGIERRLPAGDAHEALVKLAWMLLETRDPNGSDDARARDALTAGIRTDTDDEVRGRIDELVRRTMKPTERLN